MILDDADLRDYVAVVRARQYAPGSPVSLWKGKTMMNQWLAASLRGPLLALGTLVVMVAAQAQPVQVPPSSASLPLDALALSVPFAPQAVRASDGRVHLTFEILALNVSAAEVPLQWIAVFAADEDKALLRYAGEAIGEHVSPLAPFATKLRSLPASGAATVWIDVALDPARSVPRLLDVRIGTGTSAAAATQLTHIQVPVDARPVRVIRAPLAGKGWGVFEACCDFANHHRRGQRSVDGHLVLPERYAIDFVQLDANADAYTGSNINRNYFGFGKEVLAVADALVVDVHDVLEDAEPGAALPPPSLPRAGGNHVILDLGDGVWAMYGHLKARSVRVKPGDRVHAGQVLAQLGNNGNSDMPHLHFQLMNRRNFALAQGLPFEFEAFDLVGHTDAQGSRISALDRPSARRAELPLSLSVVNFPKLEDARKQATPQLESQAAEH